MPGKFGVNERSYTYDGKTVYYQAGHTTGWVESWPETFVIKAEGGGAGSLTEFQHGKIAWTVWYGSPMMQEGQPITVKWPRPGDNLILTTAFVITVAPLYREDQG